MAYTYNPYFPYLQQTQQPQSIQNGGFVNVRSIEEARNYPVAPGNSVTFKDENAPYIYTKTQGFSQMDAPIFEKYKLTKEEDVIPKPVSNEYALKSELQKVIDEIAELRKEISNGHNSDVFTDTAVSAKPNGTNAEV